MNTQANPRKVATTILAVILWLVTIVLGLQAIYAVRDIFSLILVSLGSSLADVEHFAPWLVLILALILLVFIIATSEYHRKRIGQPASWRLFAWSIAVEASILILYYII
ncbi:MAG: hypothetical protein EHM81_05365 [Chloroflexi bacterium]|nr:MAG: hypothetical protein EHM81_05365 [Chloroflexota bacterium]